MISKRQIFTADPRRVLVATRSGRAGPIEIVGINGLPRREEVDGFRLDPSRRRGVAHNLGVA